MSSVFGCAGGLWLGAKLYGQYWGIRQSVSFAVVTQQLIRGYAGRGRGQLRRMNGQNEVDKQTQAEFCRGNDDGICRVCEVKVIGLRCMSLEGVGGGDKVVGGNDG